MVVFTIDHAVLDGITDPEARAVAEDLILRGKLRLVEGDPRPVTTSFLNSFSPCGVTLHHISL